MTPPAELVRIRNHEDYAITAAGEVWRLHADKPNARYPVPRRLAVRMLGNKGSRSPHVRLQDGPGRPVTYSIAQLMRAHFPKSIQIIHSLSMGM